MPGGNSHDGAPTEVADKVKAPERGVCKRGQVDKPLRRHRGFAQAELDRPFKQ